MQGSYNPTFLPRLACAFMNESEGGVAESLGNYTEPLPIHSTPQLAKIFTWLILYYYSHAFMCFYE